MCVCVFYSYHVISYIINSCHVFSHVCLYSLNHVNVMVGMETISYLLDSCFICSHTKMLFHNMIRPIYTYNYIKIIWYYGNKMMMVIKEDLEV